MPVISFSSGISFHADAGVTLLDAAANASIPMAYSCRTGRCSSCKCKVLSGASQALHEELGLSESEKSAGWILSCVRSATTDITLEVEDLGGISLPPPKLLPCRIQALEKLTPDVIKVMLRLPPAQAFHFLPGQYINVIGPGGIKRSYSLANAQTEANLLELHVRAVPGGAMSEHWFHHAKPGDLLRLNGPLGTFFLRHVSGRDLIFLATGTGMAPVKAMLEGLATWPAQQMPRSVSVYWGARTPVDFYSDITSIMGRHRYTPVLSRPEADWSGARGYVQDALLSSAPSLRESVVYACGSDAMIHSAKKALFKAGLPEHCFLSDAFVSSAPT
jgi:CDP-4-dehydro-6-deoxyglucose reductase, E3